MAEHSEPDTASPGGEQSSARIASAGGRYWLAAAIALVAWSCLRFPQTTLTTPSLDPSWAAVLGFARQKGLQFGGDIVCTYGPLGVYAIDFFSPDAPLARIFFEMAFGFGIATGICLLAWRIALPWRPVLLGFFLLVSSPMHWGGDALYVDAGLLVWGLLCFLESGTRLRVCVATLVILATIGALVKITFLVTDLFTIGLLACDLVLRRRRVQAAGMVLGFVFAFLLGWMLLGQRVSGLGAYLLTSFAVTSGYNGAMGRSFIDITWILVMTIAAVAAVCIRVLSVVIPEGQSRLLRSGPLLLWLLGLLFEEWKYGCVRSDFEHVSLMFASVPIAAIAMEALPAASKRALWCSRAAILVCLAAAFLYIHVQIPEAPVAKFARRIAGNASKNFAVLSRPARYLRERTADFLAEQRRNQLPQVSSTVGRASVDVYGQDQLFALFNQLNYQPRPVFQSYAAYNASLMELNEHFYLSANSPEYVLFTLQPIDGRFPPLEDSLALRELLANYRPVLSEAHYVLLHRNGNEKIELTLLREGTAHPGEKINLQDFRDTTLWLKIVLEPTLGDRLLQFLYKPREAQLLIWSRSDAAPPRKFLAPPAMLSVGFLANPLALDNQDILDIYAGANVRKCDAFALELAPSPLDSAPPPFHYQIFRAQNHLGARP